MYRIVDAQSDEEDREDLGHRALLTVDEVAKTVHPRNGKEDRCHRQHRVRDGAAKTTRCNRPDSKDDEERACRRQSDGSGLPIRHGLRKHIGEDRRERGKGHERDRTDEKEEADDRQGPADAAGRAEEIDGSENGDDDESGRDEEAQDFGGEVVLAGKDQLLIEGIRADPFWKHC